MRADILIKNAAEVLTCGGDRPKRGKALLELGIIENGAVAAAEGKIIYVGPTAKGPDGADTIIDATGRVVMPGLVDCHTHAVFAGSREGDWVRKLRGEHYLEILKQGGGILSTVARTRAASKEELLRLTLGRLDEMLAQGTTTVEIKSGYGLSRQEESKILEVAAEAGKRHPIDVVKTYLGAHTIPAGTDRQSYVQEVIDSLAEMRFYAEFCDVFCEEGAFSLEQSRAILKKAGELGYKIKIHAEQMNHLGGAELAAELAATSADHLDWISESGIERLAQSDTIGVLLPGVTLYLMSGRAAPARRMIEKGAAVALATDYNPGSCPCSNMQLIMTLGCLLLKLQPAEAINAATINAAWALDRQKEIGSLEVGKKADILIMRARNHNQIPYWFGGNLVETVIKNGQVIG